MNNIFSFQPPIIAHRGASAYAPENTLSAFVKAIQLGMKWVEFDVMQTQDGKFIIFHDEHLNRTSNGKGEVCEKTYQYINTLDAGAWFNPMYASERIPQLKDVLNLLIENNMAINLEMKPNKIEKNYVKSLVDELNSFSENVYASILFSSFSMQSLYLLREYHPKAQIGLLMHDWQRDWQVHCRELACVSVHVNHEIMTKKVAQQIKDLQKFLLCYTVNDPMRALELYSWKVDAVFSDAPDVINNVLIY